MVISYQQKMKLKLSDKNRPNEIFYWLKILILQIPIPFFKLSFFLFSRIYGFQSFTYFYVNIVNFTLLYAKMPKM